MSAKAKVTTTTVKPSEARIAIRAMMSTRRACFLWGQPGIAKSSIVRQIADELGIAFIDLRLSQVEPTDLRGIPYPVFENGIHTVRWLAPGNLPRDLDYDMVTEIENTETIIRFHNPLADNGIHHCTDYEVTVKALTPGHTAEVVAKRGDRFVCVIKDEEGNPAAGKVQWTVVGEAKGILALEEFNSAPPSVQAAAYQLVLDWRLGEYIVPKGIYLMAMGNRDTDKGITYKMGTAISNRFVHLNMVDNFQDWQKWALGADLYGDVIGYLTAVPEHLNNFVPTSDAKAFATPRSWHYVSDILKANENLPVQVTIALITGCIGESIGSQFREHREHAAKLPSTGSILSGEVKNWDEKLHAGLGYTLTLRLCNAMKRESDEMKRTNPKWSKSEAHKAWMLRADNFLEFMMRNMTPEMCIMAAKQAIQQYRLPFDTRGMKHFEVFADLYQDMIMG